MKNSNYKIDSAIANWERMLRGEFTVKSVTAATGAQNKSYPDWLHRGVCAALSAMGVQQPYAHQVNAWNTLYDGENLVIATPTASGKTLCYNVPVAHALLSDDSARALYLFPTKALARDQESSVRKLLALCGLDAKAAVYDGDTPADVRRAAKKSANVIISNPDMLHAGILPHHAGWAQFFSRLRYVVVDELHQYRGVFGSHVANVFRRLDRICRFYGARPKYVGCSATIGNPGELAKKILGHPVRTISQSGAPTGKKTFLMYNPEVVDPVMGTRASAFRTAAKLAADLVQRDITTLVFCQTRRGVEIVLHYLRDRVRVEGDVQEVIRGYRGGYLPNLRREIESDLRDGRLKAVVATNALELGIDVGELDAVLLAGYPGTIAATHQRAGRAGRRQHPSLSVLIARSTPMDQFLAHHPAYLLEASPEQALVQPDNVEILLSHLRCAAFELPFGDVECFGTVLVTDSQAALSVLADEGILKKSGERFHYVANGYPAADVNIRVTMAQNVVVYNMTDNEPLADVAAHSARFELHEGAIYQHEGSTFEVTRFDPANAKAFVQPVAPVYYTTAVDQTRINLLQERRHRDIASSTLFCGDVEVLENVVGFKKIRFKTHENLGYGDLSLPPLTMETEALWLRFHPSITQSFNPATAALALDGIADALLQVASLRLMCDPRDIALSVQTAVPEGGQQTHWQPVVYIYDTHEGGVGLSERAFDEMELLLNDAMALVNGCPCDEGCPVCIGPPVSKDQTGVKDAARTILALLMGSARLGNEVCN
ncbi:MAG: DEAD/DEAH box helicase [Deltaproteobacteria bacterium]|nr:DEAD/DEAH box helicase [Deltaproteobacteria bacterium]